MEIMGGPEAGGGPSGKQRQPLPLATEYNQSCISLDLAGTREEMPRGRFTATRNLKIKIRAGGATMEVIVPDVLLCVF